MMQYASILCMWVMLSPMLTQCFVLEARISSSNKMVSEIFVRLCVCRWVMFFSWAKKYRNVQITLKLMRRFHHDVLLFLLFIIILIKKHFMLLLVTKWKFNISHAACLFSFSLPPPRFDNHFLMTVIYKHIVPRKRYFQCLRWLWTKAMIQLSIPQLL